MVVAVSPARSFPLVHVHNTSDVTARSRHRRHLLPAIMIRPYHPRWALLAATFTLGCAARTSATAGTSPGIHTEGPQSGPRSRLHGPTASTIAILRDTLRAVLDRARADSAFPGAYAVVGNRDSVLVGYGVGSLDWLPSPRPDENTLWDMASLTKVVGMTSAMMQLTEAGKVDLDAPVQRYIAEFRGPNKDRVTVRHLLTHSSGMPAWRPLYKEATTSDAARALAVATALDTLPGVRMVYSDLGIIVMTQK